MKQKQKLKRKQTRDRETRGKGGFEGASGTSAQANPAVPASTSLLESSRELSRETLSKAEEEARAKTILSAPIANGSVVHAFARRDGKIAATWKAVRAQTTAVQGGDTKEIEGMLFSQAAGLQAIFCSLAQRAAANVGVNIGATEVYLRLALKAQAQASVTLERLAEIKNPRPIFINPKQVNHSTGPQQVNNAGGPQQVNNGSPSGLALPVPEPLPVHSALEPPGQPERVCV